MKNPLIVALDVDTDKEALSLAEELQDLVGGFKLGPRLTVRYGQPLIQKISSLAPVFVDNKYFDITSTMEAAVRTSFECGASLVTVHALSGIEALTRMKEVEAELNKVRPFRILCVTVLTSWNQENLLPNFEKWPVKEHVLSMINSVKQSGLNSIVCSAHELEYIDTQSLYVVTPGIRFSMQDHQDQKRTMTPGEAIKKGASALVVGRPILLAKNRREMAADFVMSLYE